MTSFSDWLTRSVPGGCAYLRGGDARSDLFALVESLQPRSLIIVDRQLSGALLPFVTLKQGPRPELYLSRGLSKDLATDFDKKGLKAIVVPAEVLEADAVGELNRANDQLCILSGYPAPPDLVSQLIASRFERLIGRYIARQSAPLILHDRTSWLPLSDTGGITLFNASARAETSSDSDESGLLASGIAAAFRPPELQEILNHSEFLVRTEMPILLDMHRWMAGAGCDDILQYWAMQLASAAATPGHELFVRFADQKIDELRTVLRAHAEQPSDA